MPSGLLGQSVRPLAIDREPLLLPRSYPTMDPMTLSVDDVLVYSESCDDPSVIRLGYVMSVTATHAVVQYLQPAAATVITFVRSWRNDDDHLDLKTTCCSTCWILSCLP